MEDKMMVQVCDSLSSDFQKKTWTFEMGENFSVSSGKFVIISATDFMKLINAYPELKEQFERQNNESDLSDESK